MLTKTQIKKKYVKIVESYPNKDENKINNYICNNCSNVTATIDIDSGVTYFMIKCEKCGELARSTFYASILPPIEPTIE